MDDGGASEDQARAAASPLPAGYGSLDSGFPPSRPVDDAPARLLRRRRPTEDPGPPGEPGDDGVDRASPAARAHRDSGNGRGSGTTNGARDDRPAREGPVDEVRRPMPIEALGAGLAAHPVVRNTVRRTRRLGATAGEPTAGAVAPRSSVVGAPQAPVTDPGPAARRASPPPSGPALLPGTWATPAAPWGGPGGPPAADGPGRPGPVAPMPALVPDGPMPATAAQATAAQATAAQATAAQAAAAQTTAAQTTVPVDEGRLRARALRRQAAEERAAERRLVAALPGPAERYVDADIEEGPVHGTRRLRQRVRVVRGVRSRRMVRRVDVWTVFKVSFLFYLLALAVLVVAGIVVWNVATAFGLITSVEKSVRTLFSLKTFVLHPGSTLLYGSAIGAALCLVGVITNLLVAVIYNLISDVVGGVQVVVVVEPD